MSFSQCALCGGRGARRKHLLAALCLLVPGSALQADLAHASGHAPVISGTPAASVLATNLFSFQPRTADADHDRLAFSIKNRPVWASFDSRTGRLYGIPSKSSVGAYSNIVISVTDGHSSVGLHPFTLRVIGLIDRGPTISGSPPGSAAVGHRYSFQPRAAVASGDRMTFSIRNLPAWLTLDSATGRLQGTPGAGSLGTYSNIRLSVSNGLTLATLPAFSIVVAADGLSHGKSVTLDWVPPTENADSSPLTDLAGYRIYYGNSPRFLTHSVNIGHTGLTSYVFDDLNAGTWYFALTAYNRQGRESWMTRTVSTVVR